MIVVYIASPYTIGDVGQNVSKHLHVADTLIAHGFCPIAPLLFHYLHIIHPRKYEEWMAIDFELLTRCDVVLRLPGESKGVDKEIEVAKELGKPVVTDIPELLQFVKQLNK